MIGRRARSGRGERVGGGSGDVNKAAARGRPLGRAAAVGLLRTAPLPSGARRAQGPPPKPPSGPGVRCAAGCCVRSEEQNPLILRFNKSPRSKAGSNWSQGAVCVSNVRVKMLFLSAVQLQRWFP